MISVFSSMASIPATQLLAFLFKKPSLRRTWKIYNLSSEQPEQKPSTTKYAIGVAFFIVFSGGLITLNTMMSAGMGVDNSN